MERRILELAERQHGLVSQRQAKASGVSPDGWRHMLDSGAWVPSTSRVARRAGAPRTPEQAVLAAVLHVGPDGVASRSTALALWGLPGWDLLPPHVLVPRRAVRSDGPAVVHTSTAIDERHVATVSGIPTVTPVRALFDVAGWIHPKMLERSLDNAWSRHLVTFALLRRTLDELAVRGRPGIAVLRALAEARPADHRPPESNTEGRVNDLLIRAGLSPLRRQVNAGNATNWVGRFDLVDDSLPLIVEVQSELFHGSNLDKARDRARRVAMTEAGWVFVEVWETEVWRSPAVVVQRIECARRDLRCASRPNLCADLVP